MRAAAGQWVTGSIELLAPIAEGAMGRVWVAYHHGLRTRVAVKFVSDNLADDTPQALARFKLEASTASQIKSPHVVQTFDSGLSQFGAPYIVMELLEGESLGERLRRAGPLTLLEAGTVLTQVSRALTRAHHQGVVHRDIKPDNIFLTQSDEGGLFCKILDFGIAKQMQLPAMGGLTTDGKLVGTPEFMSPEQVLDDRPVDARADLWALAVVMYLSLTGELPFQGKTLGQLCLNLVNKIPSPPSSLRAGLPPGIDDWFTRALSREPGERFRSAREMANSFLAIDREGLTDLESITIDPSTDRSFGTVVRLQPQRRWSTPLAALGVVALVAFVAVAMAVLTGGEAPARLEPRLGALAGHMATVQVTIDLDAPGQTGEEREGERQKGEEQPPLAEADGSRRDQSPRPKAAAVVPRPRPAPPPPASPPPKYNDRRGKDELGF